MGRPKNFSREEVLEKAVVLFWQRGYADTSLQELEKATGVNKSGLYAEFRDKEDIFLESLRYYLANRDGSILMANPPGWQNIEKFFKGSMVCANGQKGCLAVNSMRELEVLPDDARDIITRSQVALKRAFARNVTAEKTKMDAEGLAEIIMTFFIGLSLEQNLISKKASYNRKIDDFFSLLKQA